MKSETTFDYEPFGLELRSADPANSWWTDVSSNTHRFTGHEREFDGAGLPFADYMKARMYSLNTARFAQMDPVFGEPDKTWSWNAYPYVNGNPVRFWDPEGKDFVMCTAEMSAQQCDSGGTGGGGGGTSIATVGKELQECTTKSDTPNDCEKCVKKVCSKYIKEHPSAAGGIHERCASASQQCGLIGSGAETYEE